MTGWLGDAYLWVKAAHVIVVIFWMAGLLMLPRFFVYQFAAAPGSAEDRAWTERVARLRRFRTAVERRCHAVSRASRPMP